MKFSGTIFVVSLLFFLLLVAAWFVRPDAGDIQGVADLKPPPTSRDRLHQALSGEFKRMPKKNVDVGQGRLRGTVRDQSGAPVSGATVHVVPVDRTASIVEARKAMTHYWEIESGERGGFSFRTLPGGSFKVSASRAGWHGVALAEIVDAEAFEEIELVLAPGAACWGLVQDQDGQPIAGATIIPIHSSDWPGDAHPYRFVSVTTDETGSFSHPLIPEGTWEVLVTAPKFAPKQFTLEEGGDTRITLGPGETLQGRLLREDNRRPLNNTPVVVTALDRGAEYFSMRTNGQGYFSFRGLRPANYNVHVATDRYVAHGSIEIEDTRSHTVKSDPGSAGSAESGSDGGLELLAASTASIRGRVFEAVADYGVVGIRIEAYVPGEARPAAFADSDQAGYYRLKGLPVGTYHLTAPGTIDTALVTLDDARVEVAAGEQAAGPLFRVAANKELLGTVTNTHGDSVADVNVYLGRASYPGKPRGTITDASGNFRFAGVHDEDQITIWAEKMGKASEEFGPATVGPDGMRGILLRLVEDFE
jgi:hypothetical protein